MTDQRPARPAAPPRDDRAFTRSSLLLLVVLAIVAAGSLAVLLTR